MEKLKKEKLMADLSLAQKIQSSYIPKIFPKINNFNFIAKCQMAKVVGGDYYDWYKINDDKYAFIIGDVSGKGSAAALYMVKARENFRIYSRKFENTHEIISSINNSLSSDIDVERFITVFYFKY